MNKFKLIYHKVIKFKYIKLLLINNLKQLYQYNNLFFTQFCKIKLMKYFSL